MLKLRGHVLKFSMIGLDKSIPPTLAVKRIKYYQRGVFNQVYASPIQRAGAATERFALPALGRADETPSEVENDKA